MPLRYVVVSGSICLLAITVVICVTVIAHRLSVRWEPRRPAAAVDPAQVLAERFARGEIDDAEYAHRLSVLRFGPPLEVR